MSRLRPALRRRRQHAIAAYLAPLEVSGIPIRVCDTDPDAGTGGMFPFFVAYQQRLEGAFPGEKVALGWGVEGPMTTAYEPRDMACMFGPAIGERVVLLAWDRPPRRASSAGRPVGGAIHAVELESGRAAPADANMMAYMP